MVWYCLPSTSGTGWEDHTKNMLCARCFLEYVRFDRNGKRLAVGVQVSKEGRKERGDATYQIQESHLYGVVWDRERWLALYFVGFDKSNKSTEPTHSITGMKIRGELLSNFFVGMTKLTNTRVIYVIKWALMSPFYNMIVLLKLELAYSSPNWLPMRNGADMPLAAVQLE